VKINGNGAPAVLLVLLVCLGASISCSSSGASPASVEPAAQAAEDSRKTQQQLQSELMAFADRYFAETLDLARKLEESLPTPKSRYVMAGARLFAIIVTADIAASPNPGAAVLDMCVYVTLKRMVWEGYWMPEVYGEDVGQEVLDVLIGLEGDIWGIAATVYTSEQLAELESLIYDWKSRHPDVAFVDFVRLGELGDARQVQALVDAGRPGGMLAPVKEANRSIEEMRLLAERLAFMMTRMQLAVSLQVEMAATKLASMPEIQQLLEDSRGFTVASDRLSEAIATLVADLPEERRAAVEQVLEGLHEQRERLLADIGDEDGELRPALADFRETFEQGRLLAEALDQAIVSAEGLVSRILEDEPARPFDIMDYKATISEATITVRELHQVLARVERILGSEEIEGELTHVVESAMRLEDEVINDIIDRAFIRGIALILIFFVALAVYRWLGRRGAGDRGAGGGPER
jgi:hypothetical protein